MHRKYREGGICGYSRVAILFLLNAEDTPHLVVYFKAIHILYSLPLDSSVEGLIWRNVVKVLSLSS